MRNRKDIQNIAVVKSTLQIPPKHNSAITIWIKVHDSRDQVVYFISNQHTKRRHDPNVNVIDCIYNTKDKSMLYVMVENYTNKHVILSEGPSPGHMETLINNLSETSVNNVITQKMMDD